MENNCPCEPSNEIVLSSRTERNIGSPVVPIIAIVGFEDIPVVPNEA